MKTEEDEAFDDLARKQGGWGGGFPAKRKMAADKLQEPEREVLKLALEALETERDIYREHDEDGAPEYILDAITSIKVALAQPADNPYGYDWSMLEAAQESLREHMARIKELEAQLAQPAQKHVAWVNIGDLQGLTLGHYSHVEIYTDESAGRTPLYTTPPQRPWVGLTDEEIEAIYLQHHNQYCECESPNWGYERAIEQSLKEKNNGT